MMRFAEAVKLLNDSYAHPSGYHLSTLDLGLFPEELADSDTAHDLLKQTYDWRWGEPDREEYTVELTAENMKYIGNAIEAYHKTMVELYIEPALEEIAKRMGTGDVSQ